MNTSVDEIAIQYKMNDSSDADILLLPFAPEKAVDGSERTIYAETTVSVFKKLNSSGVKTALAVGELKDLALRHNRALEWVAPTILFTYAAISQNPNIVSIVLNVISSYLYDIFKGKTDETNANCTFVYRGRKDSSCKKVTYKGPIDGLKDVEGIIRELHTNSNINS